MTDAEQIAAFLAKRGATVVPAGSAFGVDPDADKAKRAATRQRVWDNSDSERRAELTSEAFASGDREEGYSVMSGVDRLAPGVYVTNRRFERF